LAELLRLNHLNPAYHGEPRPTKSEELVRSYLTITKDPRTGHVAGEGDLPKLGDCLYPASRSMHRVIVSSG